jgi:hypothetical protein
MMALPIVDEALGRLAIDGGWRNTPMKIHLGSMLVDQKKVRVCERSYFQMEKEDDGADLQRCEKIWVAAGARYKRASTSPDNIHPPAKKARIKRVPVPTPSDNESENEEERNETEPNVCEETSTVETDKFVVVSEHTTNTRDDEDETKESGYCTFCEDNPCVWLVKKEDMLNYDDDEHDYLPVKDWPPHNVRRRKIYRQMTLFINEGPLGKGVRKELPKCVVAGCREILPSPTFMGYKTH